MVTPNTNPNTAETNPYWWPGINWGTELELAIMMSEMKTQVEDRQRALYRAEAPYPPRNIRGAIIDSNEVQDPPATPAL
ncbi:hypothetical protein KC973_03780 [Candidatus Saccharibacteria bacterium]|nr:hypothetical protein [Candidatus Saccharibacteria bacterium]